MKKGIRKELVPMELLDLKKCKTVGKTVGQMEKCAIGARMIGEVSKSLEKLIRSGKKPLIIYDGKLGSPLGKLLQTLVYDKKWFSELIRPEKFSKKNKVAARPVLVVGGFSERHEDALYGHKGRSFYVNNYNLVKPGQVKDGFFPDFIHGDPRLVLPIIFRTLEERLENKITSARSLLRELARFGGPAASASHGFETFEQMINDPDCTVIATFSGIMTVSKMGGLIAQMIDQKMVQAVTSTGALICHGFVEGVGLKHFKYDPRFNDVEMAEQKLNRITDCVEPEENLDQVEEVLKQVLDKKISGKKAISPSQINFLIGEHMAKHYPKGSSILRSAYKANIPIFIPASVDSELGNDIYIDSKERESSKRMPIVVNHEIDSRKLVDLALQSKKLGIFSLGGGVPRNNVQNVAPLIEIMNERLGLNYPERMFSYGCRIDPTLPYFGNLSGCTYSEGGSWRKMDLKHGRFSEILADATMIFPFYMAAMRERDL
jgi:deoxyhypusine synthase